MKGTGVGNRIVNGVQTTEGEFIWIVRFFIILLFK